MRLYTLNDQGKWELSKNEVPVPEGYYLLSPKWVDGAETHPKEGIEP